ncbi:hypothetical protein AB834_00110 [PVC group bacterium (ex Bugula neritina AB1)]|nr:hypothetical protein AB834_00110 [PVC group bacterium (ex Bugula neritina AB1)]
MSQVYQLDTLVYLLENNVKSFLKGMSTNTTEAVNNAFVDKNGRIVSTFQQLKIGSDRWILCVPRSAELNFDKHIEKYGRLTKTRYEKWPHRVYISENNSLTDAEYVIDTTWGKMIITQKNIEKIASANALMEWRVEKNIPWQGFDYKDQMLLNVYPEAYVSFEKGCFLGQEVLSRVKYKSAPPKKLVVAYQNDLEEKEQERMTSIIMCPKNKKKKGFVFIISSREDLFL